MIEVDIPSAKGDAGWSLDRALASVTGAAAVLGALITLIDRRRRSRKPPASLPHLTVLERPRPPGLGPSCKEAPEWSEAADAAVTAESGRCRAQTRRGQRCANRAGDAQPLCTLHQRRAARGLAVIDHSAGLPLADRVA